MAGERRGGGAQRRWKDDDPRTAVVRDQLRAVISGLVAETGRPRLDIIDAGGGTGGFAVPLAGLGHMVTVIDPSPDSLAAAQRRAAEIAVPLQAIQGDVADLPAVVGEQGADLILCHSVLEYVDAPAAALAAIARVLRPGGAVSVLAASAVAAVVHRALAGRFDEARQLLGGIAAGRPDGIAAGPDEGVAAAGLPGSQEAARGQRGSRPPAALHPGRGGGADRGRGSASRGRARSSCLRGSRARHLRGCRSRCGRCPAGARAGGVGPSRLPRPGHPVPRARVPMSHAGGARPGQPGRATVRGLRLGRATARKGRHGLPHPARRHGRLLRERRDPRPA